MKQDPKCTFLLKIIIAYRYNHLCHMFISLALGQRKIKTTTGGIQPLGDGKRVPEQVNLSGRILFLNNGI